jgi:hypothetical protein
MSASLTPSHRSSLDSMKLAVLRLVWLAAVTASVLTGAWQTRVRVGVMPVVEWDRRASSDFYLSHLGAAQLAKTLEMGLSRVPATGAVGFLFDVHEPRHAQTLFAFSVLALPRQLVEVACPKDGSATSIAWPRKDRTLSALFLHGPKREVPAATIAAPGFAFLRLTPDEATADWDSYCSFLRPRRF